MKIRVFTSFSEYDSQCMALVMLKARHPDFDYELVGWSEIDRYAIRMHNVFYPEYEERNYGDISRIDWAKVPDFDLFTCSFPCQDISAAGLQRGFIEGSGTRSSLLWECRKAILAKHPKWILMENVKKLVCRKNMPVYQKWLDFLSSEGYTNFWQVTNAKHYGIPQNRERVFCVSILNPDKPYVFPSPIPLKLRFLDMLDDESEVDDRYFLDIDRTATFVSKNKEKIRALLNGED